MRFIHWILLALFLMQPALLFAAEPAEVPRVIIGLYTREKSGIRNTNLHSLAEMPLNHLGLNVEYHAIEDPLPDIKNRPDVRGVLTWFSGGTRMKDPLAYLDWASEVVDSGKKFVILGSPGFYESQGKKPTSVTRMNQFLGKLGLVTAQRWMSLTYDMQLSALNPDMFDPNTPYGGILPAFVKMNAASPTATVHLRARKRSGKDSVDLIVTNPNGGYTL
jgi:polysaccharide biosynthesis protein PelA